MAKSSTKEALKEALARVAPELARAMGGPLAGMATGLLARLLLGRDTADEESLIEALSLADPQTLLKLKLASLDFQRELLAAAGEQARIHAQDRASARARQTALNDKTPAILAAVVLAGFFAVLAVMLLHDIPEGAETEFSIMLGALATMAAAVMNYYFGSSASSREKTWILEDGLHASSLPEGLHRR